MYKPEIYVDQALMNELMVEEVKIKPELPICNKAVCNVVCNHKWISKPPLTFCKNKIWRAAFDCEIVPLFIYHPLKCQKTLWKTTARKPYFIALLNDKKQVSENSSDTVAQFKIVNKNWKWTCEVVTFLLNIFYPNRIGQQYHISFWTGLNQNYKRISLTNPLTTFSAQSNRWI